jgi:hypothetical protein
MTEPEEKRFRSPVITSALAVIATVWILAIFTAVLFFPPRCGDGTTNLIIQAVYGLIMLVFGFYFGTSYGSMMKNDMLAKAEFRSGEKREEHRHCCRPDPPRNPVTHDEMIHEVKPMDDGGVG